MGLALLLEAICSFLVPIANPRVKIKTNYIQYV